MTSAFDPKQFLNVTQEQGFDTRYPLHKPGDWTGAIGTGENDVSARIAKWTDKQTGEAREQPSWEFWIYADNPEAQGEGFDPPARVRYDMFVDFTESGHLDFAPGKNRKLGALLTALGIQDKTGKALKPWSPNGLKGGRLMYSVEHTPRKDNGEPQANVKSVAPLS